MHLSWYLVTCLLVLLSVGLTTRTVEANKKSKEENEEEEGSSSSTDSDSDSDSDSDDDAAKKGKASFFSRLDVFSYLLVSSRLHPA